jgi:citronellol/citronellal dehydrogenase
MPNVPFLQNEARRRALVSLSGKTILMSGGSRGIGLAIALRAARDRANVVLLAKTDAPHPKLEGTIHTATAEIEQAGGHGLAVVGDVRNEEDAERAVWQAVETFGGIDIVVNNASAINLSKSDQISMKAYDLMQDVNTRGTFLLSKHAIPQLRKSANPHILTLSPPINLDPLWAGSSLAYTISKYGMSLCTLGLAEELKADGIAANSLWPRTTIDTAAIRNLLGGAAAAAKARKPAIMADAAYAIVTRDSRSCTGNFFIDEEVLRAEGVTDFSAYHEGRGDDLMPDLFLNPASSAPAWHV